MSKFNPRRSSRFLTVAAVTGALVIGVPAAAIAAGSGTPSAAGTSTTADSVKQSGAVTTATTKKDRRDANGHRDRKQDGRDANGHRDRKQDRRDADGHKDAKGAKDVRDADGHRDSPAHR
ncbi:MAG: hypothetical protein ABI611_05075 [Solirubrobacteraceae bacterium]